MWCREAEIPVGYLFEESELRFAAQLSLSRENIPRVPLQFQVPFLRNFRVHPRVFVSTEKNW
jgi:hypothetical protein